MVSQYRFKYFSTPVLAVIGVAFCLSLAGCASRTRTVTMQTVTQTTSYRVVHDDFTPGYIVDKPLPGYSCWKQNYKWYCRVHKPVSERS